MNACMRDATNSKCNCFFAAMLFSVFILNMHFCAPVTAAKKTASKSDLTAKSVRKGGMVVVGGTSNSKTASVSETNTNWELVAFHPEDVRIGIQYYPLEGVDQGPATLSNRKFKWRVYYHMKTRITVNPIDRGHAIRAAAAVVGDGIPGTPTLQSGIWSTPMSLNLGPFGSIQITTWDPEEKNPPPYEVIKIESNQSPFRESGPIVESLYKRVNGYASVQIDAGWASQATASATFDQHAMPLDTQQVNQFSVQEAFYYPDAIR